MLPALLLLATSFAQPVSPTPSSAAPQEPAVELSPFIVDDTRDVGYLATNTLAGSRFNIALKDTPASISVLTQEFLSDIGAFQLTDALHYAVNVEFNRDDDRESINGNATFQGYHTNSFWRSDLLAGYNVRGLRKGRTLSFQLNVFNVFNEREPLITRYADDGSVFRFVVQPPTTWRFTTNFEY